MSDALPWVSNVLAALALIVSVVALVKGQLRSNRLQARILDMEEAREQERVTARQKADLRLSLVPHKNHHRFVIANIGAAEARNVRLNIDDVPQQEHGSAVHGDSLPSYLGAGGSISCIAALSFECAPPFRAQVQWDDDSGTDHRYETTITF